MLLVQHPRDIFVSAYFHMRSRNFRLQYVAYAESTLQCYGLNHKLPLVIVFPCRRPTIIAGARSTSMASISAYHHRR